MAVAGEIFLSLDNIGNILVETHWIPRRSPLTLVAGMPRVLAMLKHCTGYFDSSGQFVNTSASLGVRAVEDGTLVSYDGVPANALPVLVITGRYRDFALLKTPILGTLARASRVATNAYNALEAAGGKPVFFFGARYDPPEVQPADGYAFHVAVNRYARTSGNVVPDVVATAAHARWWNGALAGTLSHEACAVFLGCSADLMVTYAEHMPVSVPRIAIVDFHNDCLSDTEDVMDALFSRYKAAADSGDNDSAARYRLHGVRIDTSHELVDATLQMEGKIRPSDFGPSARLARRLRRFIDGHWRSWEVPASWRPLARDWCHGVKIMVTGGLTPAKVAAYERQRAPVDMYGIGATMLSNSHETNTVTDFSSSIVKVKVGTAWREVAKVGRVARDNPDLQAVTL